MPVRNTSHQQKKEEINMETKTVFKPFKLGAVMITPGASDTVLHQRVIECINRHLKGDWGNLCEEDAEENCISSHEGYRILSAYAIDETKPAKGHGENCFWIITEANRESTTILLPSEY